MTARQIEPLRPALVLGALFALLAVMAGAFGAHGLRGVIDERGLEVFQTAVTYQVYHSFAGWGRLRRLEESALWWAGYWF